MIILCWFDSSHDDNDIRQPMTAVLVLILFFPSIFGVVEIFIESIVVFQVVVHIRFRVISIIIVVGVIRVGVGVVD